MGLIHPPRSATDDPHSLYDSRDLDYSHAYYLIRAKARASTGGHAGIPPGFFRHHGQAPAGGAGPGPGPGPGSGSGLALTSASASAAVLLLVNPDADGVCAARLLARLLHEDDIPYRIVPVDGYATLQSVVEEDVVGNEELHTLVLINLGSVLSLSTYFSIPKDQRRANASGGEFPEDDEDEEEDEEEGFPLPPRCAVHILDSHRPWNLDNLFATSSLMDRIFVWDDGMVKQGLAKEGEAYARLEFDWQVDEEDEEEDSENEEDSEDDDSDSDDDDDEDCEEDSADDGEDSAEEGAEKKRKRIRREGDEDDDASQDGEDEDAGSTAGLSRKQRRKLQRRKERREERKKARAAARADPDRPRKLKRFEREALEELLARYYERGTTMGLSVSGMMYMLAVKLGRSDNESLWLAILGLTSQYTHSQIPHEAYEEQAKALASDVIASNPGAEHATGGNPDDLSIRVLREELRFTLFRHWSLENAMYHTAYLAGKLNLWKQEGLTQLRMLLAKLGFSLANCRQTYEHMDLDLRRNLVKKMKGIAPEYRLYELCYSSFLRSFGFRASPLSAADAVEGISALLQAAYGVRLEVDIPGMTFAAACANGAGPTSRVNSIPGAMHGSDLFGSRRMWNLADAGTQSTGASNGRNTSNDKENRPPQNRSNQAGAKTGEPDASGRDDSANAGARKDTWVKNFFAAYNALDTNRAENIQLLHASLSLSKSLHRAVISTGISLIEKQAIKTFRGFRVAVLKDGPDLALFAHPAMLSRLAIWLIDALREYIVERETRANEQRRKRKKLAPGEEDDPSRDAPIALPFVVAALDQPRNTYVVVGVRGATDFGDVRKNKFGLAFQDAAKESGATTQHDRFETTVVEVAAAHFSAFIEKLHMKA